MTGEQIIIGLLVYEVTGTTSWVGTIMGLYFLPFFVFGMISGAIADWIDRKILLKRIELVTMSALALFASTSPSDDPPLLTISLFAVVAGSLRAMHQPVRSSYAYDLAGADNIVSAMALLNLASRTGQLIGAIAAGYVMESYGATSALYCLATGHFCAFLIFRTLNTEGIAAVAERVPIKKNIREYIAELKFNRLLLTLLAVTASVEIFGFSFATALPEIASDRLVIGAEGLGWLQGMRAFAGIIAGLIFAVLTVHNRTGIIYLGVICAFSIFLSILSVPMALILTLIIVFLVSFCAASCDILSQSMMQLSVANELRGRAMGIWVLALGFGPLGHLELGMLSSSFGLQYGLLLNGIILLVIAILVGLVNSRLRSI